MPKGKYKIKVDESVCIGCGACASECPENWELKETSEGFKGHAKSAVISEEELDKNKAAESICPVQAISITKG